MVNELDSDEAYALSRFLGQLERATHDTGWGFNNATIQSDKCMYQLGRRHIQRPGRNGEEENFVQYYAWEQE
jgi:hypothetical protein